MLVSSVRHEQFQSHVRSARGHGGLGVYVQTKQHLCKCSGIVLYDFSLRHAIRPRLCTGVESGLFLTA